MLRIFACVVLLTVATALPAQTGTRLNLATDGRVIAGARLTYYLHRITEERRLRTMPRQYPLSQGTEAQLDNKGLLAVIVPPQKIGDDYLLGLVFDNGSAVIDARVTQQDFETFRRLSTSATAALADATYSSYRAARSNGGALPAAKLQTLAAAAKTDAELEQYAGYLFAELPPREVPKEMEIAVARFRVSTERAALQLLAAASDNGEKNGERLTFFAYGGEQIALPDLYGAPVEHAAQQPQVLKVWKGRSLVIAREREGVAYSKEKYPLGIPQYLQDRGVDRLLIPAMRSFGTQ